jgi:hypothetical protein
LYVDDVRLEAAPRIESVAFLGDGQVAWVAHREKSSQLLRNDKVVAERDLISAVYVSPRGDLSYGGEHQGKRFLEPAPAGLSFTSLFGEGFLASGELYAIAARAGGGKVLVKGTATAGPFDAITGTVLSPDRTEVAAVGRSAAGRDTLLVGTTAVREFEGVVAASVWCKGMKGPVIHVQSGVEECLRGADGADVCCPRVVLWGCSEGQGVTAVCSTGKGFEVRTAGKSGSPAAYEDVPLGLFYSDPLEGHVAFAGRRGEQWVVMVDGKEWPVEARPVLVLPEEDGPWYQVVSGAGQKFVRTGGPTRAYQQVNAPVFHKGHSLFRAREGGKDVWVVDGVETLRCERLDPAPVPAGDGVLV